MRASFLGVLALGLCACGDNGGGDVIAPDETPPTVSLVQPVAGPVTGTVTLVAQASDNVGVAGVRFLMNDIVLGPEDHDAPYQFTWDTEHLPNGSFDLTAVAFDAAGNQATSAPVSVSVQNTSGFGRLIVTVTETGGGADPDGYAVLVDGSVLGTITPGNTDINLEVRTGTHLVELGDVAPVCRVTGDAVQAVEVLPSQLIPVIQFTVECAAP